MNLEAVRRILRADRGWSAYALGDLASSRLSHTRWFVDSDASALVLLYAEFGTPILFAAGPPPAIGPILAGIDLPPAVCLQIRPAVLPLVEAHYPRVRTKTMLRMVLRGSPTVDASGAEPLTIADAAELKTLYRDGERAGEAPDFYFSQMLEDGAFHGIRCEGRMVAAAGTHILNEEEGIAAIGNVYTHRNFRNRGFGRKVTAAVMRHLTRLGIETQALNVHSANPAAIRVYESLGFSVHCEFLEGEASQQSAEDAQK